MIKQTVAHMEIGVKKHKDSSIAGLIEELIGSSPKTNTNSVMLPRLYRRYRVTHFNTSKIGLQQILKEVFDYFIAETSQALKLISHNPNSTHGSGFSTQSPAYF